MSTITTPRGFKLGKKNPVASPFRPFHEYFDRTLPSPPSSAHWGRLVKAPWQLDGNGPDPQVTIMPSGWGGAGDCVKCGEAHLLLLENYDEFGQMVGVPTANDVVQAYCTAMGCTPEQLAEDPNQFDNGEDISSSLATWAQTEIYGVKLAFTAPVDSGSSNDIKNGIYLGGGLTIGIQLPQSAEEQFPNEWTWEPSSPLLGGHDVDLVGYTDDYVALVTWGQLIRCSWEFLKNTIDEAHAVVLPQAVAAGKSPSGLLLQKWESDLGNLKAA